MISKKNKLILLLPPKTGSTSFKRCLIQSGIHFDLPTGNVKYPVYHSTLTEIIESYEVNKDELNEYKIIQIVRNPFDRFVSAWKHQNDIIHSNLQLSDMVEKVSKHKHLLPNNIDDFYTSFYGSISFKHNAFRNGNWGGMKFWCEQNWWNLLNDTTKYFKLENLKNNTEELSDYLGIKLPEMPHIKPNKESIRDSDYRIYYNENIKGVVSKLYENDLKLFDYEF